MKKANINLVLDFILFILLITIASIGLLIKYVLLSGKDQWVKYGSNSDASFLNLDRHQWGEIHLIIGLLFIFILIIHFILHWKMISKIYIDLIKSRKIRLAFSMSIIAITLSLLLFPFLINIDCSNIKLHNFEIKNTSIQSTHSSSKNTHHNDLKRYKITNDFSLSQLSKEYSIPLDTLSKKLNLPPYINYNETLHYLKKHYNFNLKEVKLIIHEYHKNNSK
jgi:hypothetical protein